MYVHVVEHVVDAVLNMPMETLHSCYGPEYIRACSHVDYPVEIGFIWDEQHSKYVDPKTLQNDSAVWDEMAEAYRKGVQEA